jgi:anaerobic ribonucleoside-triphosphate reductase activating protein
MKLSGIDYKNRTCGPGERTEIFLQGCMNVCEGCFNLDAKVIGAGDEIPVQEVMNMIREEGNKKVTICGGEPFLQIDELYSLLVLLKKEKYSVMCYTGLLSEELYLYSIDKGPLPDYLIEYSEEQKLKLFLIFSLSMIDVLIDGPFDISVKRPVGDGCYIGSYNQRLICPVLIICAAVACQDNKEDMIKNGIYVIKEDKISKFLSESEVI